MKQHDKISSIFEAAFQNENRLNPIRRNMISNEINLRKFVPQSTKFLDGSTV